MVGELQEKLAGMQKKTISNNLIKSFRWIITILRKFEKTTQACDSGRMNILTVA